MQRKGIQRPIGAIGAIGKPTTLDQGLFLSGISQLQWRGIESTGLEQAIGKSSWGPSVLQCVAACCSVLQRVAACWDTIVGTLQSQPICWEVSERLQVKAREAHRM